MVWNHVNEIQPHFTFYLQWCDPCKIEFNVIDKRRGTMHNHIPGVCCASRPIKEETNKNDHWYYKCAKTEQCTLWEKTWIHTATIGANTTTYYGGWKFEAERFIHSATGTHNEH